MLGAKTGYIIDFLFSHFHTTIYGYFVNPLVAVLSLSNDQNASTSHPK